MTSRLLAAMMLVACGGAGDATDSDSVGPSLCEYPAATTPMALDAPLEALYWAQARRADGSFHPLSLQQAHCGDDTSYDWSPHDYMLFVSVPAW